MNQNSQVLNSMVQQAKLNEFVVKHHWVLKIEPTVQQVTLDALTTNAYLVYNHVSIP